MITRRLWLAGILLGVSLLVLTAPAGAHPGHDAAAVDGFHAASQADGPISWSLRGHGAAAVALVVAVGSLLASLPQRRRVLALTLVLLLSSVSLEAVWHAVLHLHHARHADGLAIGASHAQQSAVDPDPGSPSAAPVVLIGAIIERADDRLPRVVVASSRGRAPPPASFSAS